MKLEVKNLRKTFGDTEVLHGINFSVEKGKALGLLGRNGAGKTTTIRILMDVFKATEGEILLDGEKFNPLNYQIGYMPEERGLYPKKKVIDQIIYFGTLRGLSRKEAKENAKKWLAKLQIEKYENKLLETLSKGNAQKVQLAQTLVCNPEIVILDEPFSGLDPVNSQILEEIVKELINDNKIVIFSSHQMTYVEEFCEEIVIINNGEVALSGNVKKIKKEFGQGKLILSATNYDLNELEQICNNNEELKEIIKVDCKKTNVLVLELRNGKNKKDLISVLLNNDVDIDKFGTYEPSLHDIFVLKAGDK